MPLLLLAAWLAPAVAVPAQAADPQAGAIRGSILDKDFQVPLAGVRVAVAESRAMTLSAQGGAFVVSQIPPGTYTLSFSKDGYEREVVPNVQVTSGHMTDLQVEMSSEVVELEELVVSGVDPLANGDIGLLEIRATAVSVQDAISSDLISKAGVSDVAGALKLVVGTSVAEGKYATVRGLSDRYTGTTLNGIRIPSADPRRRAVQMDLFPTGTIESVTVTKTFTPDLQGDFTGGGVDIKTKSIPDGLMLKVTESIGYNTRATGNDDRLTYVGGGLSPTGTDPGNRSLPSGADDPLPSFPRFSPRPPASEVAASEEYDGLVRSFSSVIGVSRSAPGANYGFSVVLGDRFEMGGDRVLGLMGALSYSRKYDYYDSGVNNNAVVSSATQPITLTKPREDSRGVDELLIGSLAGVVFRPKLGHELSLQYVRNQAAEDEARFQIQDTGGQSVEQNQSLHYTQRQVTSLQLHGAHKINLLNLSWTAATNGTEQEEPDVRFFRNTFNYGTLSGEMPSNSTDAQNTRRIFREIQEDDDQAELNLTLPMADWAGVAGDLRAGLFVESSDRGYEQRSYTYHFATQLGSTNPVKANKALARFQATDRDQLWTDVFLDSKRIGLASNHPTAPNQLLWTLIPLGDDVDYTGQQEIQAAYAMVDMNLGQRLRLIAGARYETTDLSIEPTNDAFGRVQIIEVTSTGDRAIVGVPEEDAAADIGQSDLLPSVGLVYSMRSNMNLRATWSRTVARPTFREMAPVATEEFIFGDEFIGNPALGLSSITNYDLRWEWFRKTDQLFAASLFYKTLTDPIELISFATGGRSFVQPVNFDKGRVIGVEMEARTPLDFLGGVKGFMVGANVTFIRSEVRVPEFERESLDDFGLDQDTRQLQGQPAYLLNLNGTWDHERTGTSVGLFYNLIGETLLTGAARGVEDGNPDVFEQPFATLDFKVSRRLSERYSVSFRAENILGRDRRAVYRTPDGEEELKSLRTTASQYTVSGMVSW